MSLPHFFAGAPEPGEVVRLTGEEARHAVGSLRLRSGDGLTSSDGRGAVVRCRVTAAGRGSLEAEVEERRVHPPPRPELSVILAPAKGERLTWAIQKLAELGTERIVLAETSRSVRRWRGDRAGRAVSRAAAVAREASKQARRPFLPEVAGPLGWGEALDGALARGPSFVLWERADGPLKAVLPAEPPDAIALAIGPEGGLTEEEAAEAQTKGALLASLGEGILRTETAAVAAAAVVLADCGRLG